MIGVDLTIALGIFAFAALCIYGITSLIIYRNIRGKVFYWYSFYCLFLALYISFKFVPYYNQDYLYKTGINWYIQIIYYMCYVRFGIYFIEFDKYYPITANRMLRSQIWMVLLGTIAFILELLGIIDLLEFFIYFFLPYLVILSLIIIYDILSNTSAKKKYFLYGSVIYMVLALLAFILSVQKSYILFPNLLYFYVAVIVESFIFSFGLGMLVRDVYFQKLDAEKDLNKIQGLLQIELEKKIVKQDEINRLLKNENLSKELKLKVADLNNTVLRNQMNSHFVFNVLNSIKLFMMQEEKEKAVQYLNKFAKFMRKVLDANFYGNITLQEEIETIELYLSIELMRFDYTFNYVIETPPNLNLTELPVPAFILQPFIENVIWHAFVGKEGEKHLWIKVTQDKKIIIEDNGIGREATRKLGNEFQSKKSYGLTIIQERLNNYNKKNDRNLHYTIEDLPIGTRVTLHLK